MAISPSTDLYLLKLPIELNDENQLTFANATAQASYFLSLDKIGETDFTYQRRENAIRYPAHIDSILQYNYVMYKNENYTNKWFYARIMNMEYINDGMTLISIEEDTFQTWQFDLNYSQCFVEREHVNNDTVGLHTLPERFELGEPVQNSSTNIAPDKEVWTSGKTEKLTNKYMIIFQVTELPTGSYGISNPHEYNSVYSGLFLLGVKTASDATSLIYKYDQEDKSEAIVAIFMAPTEFFDGCEFSNIMTGYGNVTVYYPKIETGATNLCDSAYTITRPSTLDGYTPKNGKMLCFPFSYITVDNNSGTCITQRFESFGTSSTPSYWMAGALCQGCSIKLLPVDYKGSGTSAENYNEGVVAPKLPICGWSSDYFVNWETQNAVNIPLTIGSSIVGAGMGLASGNPLGVLGGVVSSVSKIAGLIDQRYQASLVPDQAKGNANSGDLNIAYQRFFTVKCMSVKAEYARVIDNYFSTYGYLVNTTKVPNVTGRTNWNFVKTVGSAIHADIPSESCDRINHMFDNGLTLWHNPATFRDYTQPNTIVTP